MRQRTTSYASRLRYRGYPGKPVVFNGFIVIGGFSVLMLATTTPPQQVGTYVAISVAASLATTFLVLSVATRGWNVAPTKILSPEVEHV